MEFPLYSTVILTRNLSEFGFREGDVATIVDFIKNDTQEGYILEFFDVDGDTIAVVPVLTSDIAKPYPKAVVNYRRLAKTA
jgi:Domain of unknown function (DUF4926)